jgi:uncharacterized protein (DUF3084 family)
MNKFTIEADGESIEVKLVQPDHETLTALMIGKMDLCYGKRAERIYNILRNAYAEQPNLSEAYEQLRIEHEAMREERDRYLRDSKDWEEAYHEEVRSTKTPTPQPAPKTVRVQNLSEAYEQLFMEHQAMREERDRLRDATTQPARNIVQISGDKALCNDGSVWALFSGQWYQLRPIPQGDTQ